MKELSQEELNRWKETFAKDSIKYETDDDYREAVSNLTGFFDVLVQIDQRLKADKDTGLIPPSTVSINP